jgi:hypothetical protein
MKEEKKPITVAEAVRQFEKCQLDMCGLDEAKHHFIGVLPLMISSLRHLYMERISLEELEDIQIHVENTWFTFKDRLEALEKALSAACELLGAVKRAQISQ